MHQLLLDRQIYDRWRRQVGGDEAYRFEDSWYLHPQTGELIPRPIADHYGLCRDEQDFKQWRHERYEQWLRGELSDELIPPPWDFRHATKLFQVQRRTMIELHNGHGVPLSTPTFNPFDLDGREQKEQADLEYWFLRRLPAVCPPAALANAVPSSQHEAERPSKAPPRPKRRRASMVGITEAQFVNAYNAVAFANYCGCAMNTHVSVTWSTVGVVDDVEVRKAHEGLLELMRKFLTKTLGLPAYWVWALEKSDKRGLHSHILLHVPKRHLARFKARLAHAVATLTGVEPLKTDDSSTIYARCDDALTTQWIWFLYLMKGLELDLDALEPWQSDYVESFSKIIGHAPTPQGQFEGQRVGTSRALGASARKAGGFESMWDLGYRKSKFLYETDYKNMSEVHRLLATIQI